MGAGFHNDTARKTPQRPNKRCRISRGNGTQHISQKSGEKVEQQKSRGPTSVIKHLFGTS